MKKIMKLFVLVAAAAMALASCQKNEIDGPVKKEVHFTIKAGIESKTSIEESLEDGKTVYKAQWDGNEELGVLFAAPDGNTKPENVVKLTNSEKGRLASFQGNVTIDATSGTFYAFYPAAAFNRGYAEGDARLDLKNVQEPTATSFDPSCDILVAKPYDYTVEEGAVVADGLEFARIMSVLRIDLKSEFEDIKNEFVESVSFTAGDVEITGYARIFLDNPKFDKWSSNGAQFCTVTANYDSEIVSINGTSNSVYLVIAPVTIPAEKELIFEIKTKNHKISKTVMSPEMNFTAGKVSKINLTIVADNCEKIDTSIDYSGEYLIVNADLTKAASKWENGNNLPAVVLNSGDGVVYESDNLADCKMTITKVTEGENAGKYTIQDASGKYLYAAGGSGSNPSNYLKGQTTASYWSIEEDGAKFVMTSLSGATRNILRYNGTNNPPIFSCYGTGQSDVTLYKFSDIKPDTNPKLELDNESIEFTSEGGEGTIAVTAKNLPAEIQVRALAAEGAQDEVNWLTVEYTDGVITYTATANESTEARTAYIEVYVSDDLKAGVSVTQAGKPAEGAPVEVTDVLTRATTGVTGTSYAAWSDKKVTSSAVYAGQSAGDKESIQLRSKNDNSGIVTTASGGYVKKIKVTWNSGTTSGRTLDVYGKNTAYLKATELYATNAQGTKLGSIKYGTSTELEITGDYKYIGLRSSDGAMYLTQVEITWASGSEGGETTTPQPRNLAFSSATAEATVGEAFTAPNLSGETSGVTYSSSNTSVATVDANTGKVTLVAAGTTTITATAPGTEQYMAETVSYILTVKAEQGGGDEPEQPAVTVSTTIANYAAANGWENSKQYKTVNLDNVVTAAVSGGSNTGKYYTSGTNWRIYQNESPTLKISASDGYTLKTVKITYVVEKTGVLTLNGSNITSGSDVTVNASSITFGVGNTSSNVTNGQVRVTKVEVVYQKN